MGSTLDCETAQKRIHIDGMNRSETVRVANLPESIRYIDLGLKRAARRLGVSETTDGMGHCIEVFASEYGPDYRTCGANVEGGSPAFSMSCSLWK